MPAADSTAGGDEEIAAHLIEPHEGKIYGAESGKTVQRVLGVKKNALGHIIYFVRYTDNTYELVPSNVLINFAASHILEFLEARLHFI